MIWGENSQLEYGGTENEQLATDLNDDWLNKHGCMEGTSANDWVGVNNITVQDMVPYQIPKVRDFIPKSIFLGSFIKWNSFEILNEVCKHGFIYEENKGKVGVWDFADIEHSTL